MFQIGVRKRARQFAVSLSCGDTDCIGSLPQLLHLFLRGSVVVIVVVVV